MSVVAPLDGRVSPSPLGNRVLRALFISVFGWPVAAGPGAKAKARGLCSAVSLGPWKVYLLGTMEMPKYGQMAPRSPAMAWDSIHHSQGEGHEQLRTPVRTQAWGRAGRLEAPAQETGGQPQASTV